MPDNAPYFGGFSPGAQLFAVDGDFTSCDPCGPPVISFPMKGDSILSIRDIFYFDPTTPPGKYRTYTLGTYPNIQPWSPNQDCMMLEQEFMVAQQSYQPMRLNTPYNPDFGLGWIGTFPDGQPIPAEDQFYLVSEGELVDMGGGISKIKRTWATIPPVRNEVEQFTYTYIGFTSDTDTGSRSQQPIVVQSRVQYDYFIFDDFGVSGLPVFPAGPALNGGTGLSPLGLILQAQFYYALNNADTISARIATDVLNNGDGIDPTTATVPPLAAYLSIAAPDGSAATSNTLTAELVAESSTMTRYMGNIWERRTRFVIAQ